MMYRSAIAAVALATVVCAQDERVDVPASVVDAVGAVLPERSNAGAAFLAPGFSPNLFVEQDAEVRLIFIWENTRQSNSLGWFSWREVGDGYEVIDTGMLFPEVASRPQGPLEVGDAVWLKNVDGSRRTFQSGDRVGFFLLADGFDLHRDSVTNWRQDLGIPSATAGGNGPVGCFTTLPAVNPEAAIDVSRAAHVALVRMPGQADFLGGFELMVMGFEDLDRTRNSDDDFNDTVFLVDVQPPEAIDRTRTSLFDPGDRDGDKVAGVSDAFPDDPSRAWVRRVPQFGYTVLAFEDFYPISGDGDFNDAVFALAFTTVLDGRNRVTDVIADFHLVARGASWDHEFGLHVPTLPNGTRGTVHIQRFDSGDAVPQEIETRDLAALIRGGRRIDGIFTSTVGALPRAVADKPFANTWPGHPAVFAASARVWIEIRDPVREVILGPPPFDPFLFVTQPDGTRADVHLPGFESFADRSAGLPVESGPKSFLDLNGEPWALMLPTAWQFPMEGVPIARAYPLYTSWASSGGRQDRTWYEQPTAEPDKVSVPIGTLIPARDWTLRGPGDRF